MEVEEDNAIDIFRSICREGNTSLSAEDLPARVNGGRAFRAKVFARGNILCVEPLAVGAEHQPLEPLLFVLERFQVRRDEPEDGTVGFPFSVCFACEGESVQLTMESDKKREEWMLQLARCSHQMAKAELDEITYKLHSMSTRGVAGSDDVQASSSGFESHFLTAPYKHVHDFSISNSMSLPSRHLVLEEVLWESRLSFALPIEFVKMYKKWTSEQLALLETRQFSFPQHSLTALHETLRQLREASETLDQTLEFLSQRSDPWCYRKSTDKRLIALAPVPTNLHLHAFKVGDAAQHHVVTTCGTPAALPFRFPHGGLTRLISHLEVDHSSVEPAYSARRTLIAELKRNIGQLSHRLETEWSLAEFGKPDKVCVELLTGVKQVWERLRDCMGEMRRAAACTEQLIEAGKARREHGGAAVSPHAPVVSECLSSQADAIEAQLISLHTKAAVIDTLDEAESDRAVFFSSCRAAMCASLDRLLQLADTLGEAHLLAGVEAVGRDGAAAWFHVQLRGDVVLSQAATIAATALLVRLNEGWPCHGDSPLPFHLVVFSWLSAYGDERGMVEDAHWAWRSVAQRVGFRVVRAPSAVSRTCVPQVAGTRACIVVSLPVPQSVFDTLPRQLREEEVRIGTSFFSLGVNHEATLSHQMGGCALEETIQKEAARNLSDLLERHPAPGTAAKEAVTGLFNAIRSEPSRKNMDIFDWAMRAACELSCETVICCKSGKDRTAMGVTLEQGRRLRETEGLTQAQTQEVVSSLRRNGVRRECCRKNVGKALYSFSPFQMHFLPKQFRPPSGCYAQGLST